MLTGPDPGGVICLSCGRGWPCQRSNLPGHTSSRDPGSPFRPAVLEEYLAWLAGYVAGGGTVSHVYDYPWERAGMVTATRCFLLRGECGAQGLRVIAPPRIGWTGPIGHSSVYRMDGYGLVNSVNWVPAYSDPQFAPLLHGAYASGGVVRTYPARSYWAVPSRVAPSFPRAQTPHVCPVPQPGAPAVFCERCRVWRWDSGASVVAATPEADGAQLMADNRALAAKVRELKAALERVDAEPQAEPPPPAPATVADLEPGWWGQPDVPDPAPPKGACRDCGLTWPPPTRPGPLCRYCRLAAGVRGGPPGPPLVAPVAVLVMLAALIVCALAYAPGPVPAALMMVNAAVLAVLALGRQRRG